MFAERFDALMNIAEVTNSLLGRGINMNPSHIGRLRSGARPLPKKHEYLYDVCKYLAGHIKKDYQIEALQKLTNIKSSTLASIENTALFLKEWLLEENHDTSIATGRLISGFSHLSTKPANLKDNIEIPQKYATYLYGNAGKRKAVEQFFSIILQEEKPQTLLLYSNENMAWLYEDESFALRWASLFAKVIQRGNRVKIIHTVSRDINEMIEAVTKWIPIYMTGMIEPYYYPRIKDGIFQHTMFIAPNTAAVISSSVQQDTKGMLNLFISDKAAVDALKLEYEQYLSLCQPLMHIYTKQDENTTERIIRSLIEEEGNAYFYSKTPPLFTMPKKLVHELKETSKDNELINRYEQSLSMFKKVIKKHHLTLILLNPKYALQTLDTIHPLIGKSLSVGSLPYTKEQYQSHIEYLKQMKKHYKNLKIRFIDKFEDNTLLYVKENVGVVMTKLDNPQITFIINENNMVNAFLDYIEKSILI